MGGGVPTFPGPGRGVPAFPGGGTYLPRQGGTYLPRWGHLPSQMFLDYLSVVTSTVEMIPSLLKQIWISNHAFSNFGRLKITFGIINKEPIQIYKNNTT